MGGPGSGWRGSKKLTTDECLTLSISDSIEIGVLVPGWREGKLRWRQEGQDGPIAEIGYSSTMCADGTGTLRLRYTADGEPVDYCIELVSTLPPIGGRRWWFKCPVTGTRAANLYLPPGAKRFASRQAHDLTYRSCQESGKFDRSCRWMAKRLGRDEAQIRELLMRGR